MDTAAQPDLAARRTLAIGTAIGPDLTVTGVLGEGGTGVVYAAYHALLRREVAVKMSHMSGPMAQEGRARLVREAQMCASVRSAHLPRIYALDELADGTPYIVMEKVEGVTLSHTLAQRRLSPMLACAITERLLTALSAVHKKGIVHRDIKPSNLIINLRDESAPELRLLDFGVGKVVKANELEHPSLTCRGELLGTPLYMAPEQVLGMAADARTDLYAAGIVLYEMLAGRTPFAAESVGEVFAAVLRDEITPLSSLRPDLPAPLLALVAKATAKKAEERYADALSMLHDLKRAMAELPPPLHASELEPLHDRASHTDLEPTLVFPRARRNGRDARYEHDNAEEHAKVCERERRRTLSLSLARTVKVRPGMAENLPPKSQRARLGFRAQREALAFDQTVAR